MTAIDFETLWDADYSLSKMGVAAYCRHEKFDAYQVAIVNATGIVFVGHPRDFNWESLRGELLVAHNVSFDGYVLKVLQEKGIVPRGIGEDMVCTADLSVYFQGPRDLQGAAKQLLGMTISKAYRAKSKGKTVSQMKAEGSHEENVEAGAADGLACYKIAEKYLPLWPEAERLISKINRETGWRGTAIDVDKNREAMLAIAGQRVKMLRLMVWADNADDAPLSMEKIRAHGRKVGVPVPASLDAKSADAKKWYLDYGTEHPWVLAVRDYRRLNTIYKKLEVLDKEVDETGIFALSKKYFGASTGRFSGGGRFNVENLPRGKLFDIDMRAHLIPRPGHLYLGADYAQIEARLLLWRVGDADFINVLNEVGNIYVAYDIKTGRYPKGTKKKDMDPKDYLSAKIKVLGLGYGMGAAKYKDTALVQYGLEVTKAEAQDAVNEFRGTNWRIVNHWRWHDQWLKTSASHRDPTHDIMLRSGRKLVYHEPREKVEEMPDGRSRVAVVVKTTRGSHDEYTYGGKLTENEIQATARDVLRDAWIGLHNAGYKIITTIHDEFLLEIPEHLCTEETKKDVRRIMLTSSPWAVGAPLDVDLEDMKYTKCFCK